MLIAMFCFFNLLLILQCIDRPRILSYNVNQRDEIRRRYWLKGPNQPSGHIFLKQTLGISKDVLYLHGLLNMVIG